MSNELRIAIEFDSKELESKEKIILAYQPLYKEVGRILSDLYILGLICEKLESQGLIVIDEKEKNYFTQFKNYHNKTQIEQNKDNFLLTSVYFEELYEEIMNNLEHIEIRFENEGNIKNDYIKESVQKWK